MSDIPRPALWLGLAGLIPFLYAAWVTMAPGMTLPFAPATVVFELYGLVIFAYMAGVLWGFAAGGAPAFWWYGLAVTPAVIVFLAILLAPMAMHLILMIAFPALLFFDRTFHGAGLAPE